MPKLRATQLAGVVALLVADHHDRHAVEPADAADDRRAVAGDAVAVQFDEVVEQPGGVVQRGRPARVAGQPDRLPGVAARASSSGRRASRGAASRQVAGTVRAPPRARRPRRAAARASRAARCAGRTASIRPWPSRNSAVWKPGGQRLADGLRDHPGPGEAHPRARLGEDHVGERGERGRDPAVGGVGDAARPSSRPASSSAPSACAGLGHLHQRRARPPACARRPRR